MKIINVLKIKKMLSLILAVFMMINEVVPSFKSDAATKYKYVYVVSKISGCAEVDYSYYPNGMVKKINKKDFNQYRTFKYDKAKRVTSVREKDQKNDRTYKLVYNKKGKLVRLAGPIETWNCSYGTNRSIRMVAQMGNGYNTRKIVRDKKNRVKKVTYTYGGINNNFVQEFKYNKKGYISKFTQGQANYNEYTYTYKNCRISKINMHESLAFDSYYEYDITYKKIKVPKSSVKAVKAQQKQLLQPETDYLKIYYNSTGF